MASGTIQISTNEATSGSCKMPDGTLIQWGTTTVPSGTYVETITFSKSFVNTNYTLTFGVYDAIEPSINIKYTGGCRVGRTPNTASNNIEWQAIGRWK